MAENLVVLLGLKYARLFSLLYWIEGLTGPFNYDCESRHLIGLVKSMRRAFAVV